MKPILKNREKLSRYYGKKAPGQSGGEDKEIKLNRFLWQNIYINMTKS